MTTATREKIQGAYSTGADEYDQVRLEDARGRMLSEHDQRIFASLFPRSQGDMNVVEIGAGTGRFTVLALERGFSLTATDINQEMLDLLTSKAASMNAADRCQVQIQDAFNLTLEKSHYDYVFSLHVIPRFLTVEDQQAAIKSIASLVKPGGRFLFNYRNSKSFYNLLYKGPAATPGQIRQALEASSMHIETRRGKWLVNKRLLRRLPVFVGRVVIAIDAMLLRFWPDRSWDVFVVAVKDR